MADFLSGVTNVTQQLVLKEALDAGSAGITVAEVRAKHGYHHGRVSSAMTKQHIAGRLVALLERRGHSGVYVLPEFLNGRETRPYRRQGRRFSQDDIANVAEELAGHDWEMVGMCSCGVGVSLPRDFRIHVAEAVIDTLTATNHPNGSAK